MKKNILILVTFLLVTTISFAQSGTQPIVILGQPPPTLSVINNYKGTDIKLKPKSFKITVKNNSIEAIDQPTPKGWTRTPSKFPPGSSTVTWTNNSDIPYGEEINLGTIHFGKVEKFSMTCQWLNAAGEIIYQTEKLWSDYNPHDPGVADSDMTTGKGASYQVKWTPVVPPPPVNDLSQAKSIGGVHPDDVPPIIMEKTNQDAPAGVTTLIVNPRPTDVIREKKDKPIVRPILSHLRPGVMIYLGAGTNSPSSDTKNNAYATNTVGFDANVFVPVIKKKNFSFGFNAGGEYFSGNKDNAPSSPQPFHVIGETSSTVAVTSSGSPKTSGFKVGAAPQVNFFLGNKVMISPMIELGYMSMTAKGFSAVQTTNLDGTLYNFTLLGKTETKTSGLAITPKVRLNYMFTKKIGMWLETNYTMGPTVINSISTFTPQDTPDENGQYNIDQMMNGTTTTKVRETKFSSFGVHVGVVLSIYDKPIIWEFPY